MLAALPVRGLTVRDNDGVATIDLTLDSERGGDTNPRPLNVAQTKLSPQPPPFNRRHSFHPIGSKPLRSSPLAGPALSSAGSTPKPSADSNDNFPRTLSHPDIAALSPPPPARHARPRSSQGFEPVAGPSRVSTPVIDNSSIPDSPSRHSFFLGLEKRRSKRLSVTSPLEVPPVACPPVPEWALQQRSSHVEQRRPRSSHADLERNRLSNARPKSMHGYPIPNDNSSSLAVPVPPLPNASLHESSNPSWLTSNVYDTTPRFSRLGLSASNVVLPVSAREHKRLSKVGSNASIRSGSTITGSRSRTNGKSSPTNSLSRSSSSSNISAAGQSSPSTPSLSLTRSHSASSSDESLRTPSVIPGSSAPSSVSLDITTIVEDDEEQHVGEPNHVRTFSISNIRKGTLSRMTGFRHGLKASRSHNDVHTMPERGADVSAKAVPSANEHLQKDAKAITISVTHQGVDGEEVSAAVDERKDADATHQEKGNGVSKKHGTIRRLWKTISGAHWARATR